MQNLIRNIFEQLIKCKNYQRRKPNTGGKRKAEGWDRKLVYVGQIAYRQAKNRFDLKTVLMNTLYQPNKLLQPGGEKEEFEEVLGPNT